MTNKDKKDTVTQYLECLICGYMCNALAQITQCPICGRELKNVSYINKED